jgi:hypothetical protein
MPIPELEAHETSSMAALGAAALAHSASRVASTSSPVAPGSLQLPPPPLGWMVVKEPAGKLELRPKVLRNVVQSEVANRSLSSISAMVWPWPEIPLLNSGLRL